MEGDCGTRGSDSSASRNPGWEKVAQATRLFRPATRRSKREGASGLFPTAGFMANLLSVPLGRWPNETGQLPVPPNSSFLREFGFTTVGGFASLAGAAGGKFYAVATDDGIRH